MDLHVLHNRRGSRLAVAALALVLAPAVLVACGNDDGDGSAGGATDTVATDGGSRDGGTAGGGGDGKGGGGKGDGGGAAASQDGPALTGDVEQARRGVESVDDVYESFAAAVESGVAAVDVPARQTLDSAAGNESLTRVCDLMSEDAKRQTVVYARRSAGLADVEWSCEKATGLLLRRARQSGGLKRSLRAKVVGVNVDGDSATASVRFGGKGPISSLPLVKEDGEWKIGTAPAGGGGE